MNLACVTGENEQNFTKKKYFIARAIFLLRSF